MVFDAVWESQVSGVGAPLDLRGGSHQRRCLMLLPTLCSCCRVELKPSLQQLFDTVQNTCKAAVAALEVLPRLLPDVLSGCAAAGPLPGCLRCDTHASRDKMQWATFLLG